MQGKTSMLRKALSGALLSCALLANCSPLRAEDRLTIRLTAADYAPLTDLKLPHGGILTRLVAEVFRQVDVDTSFERVPNNRAITGVMKGMYDGSFGWAYTPERAKTMLYSEKPIHGNRMIFMHRTGKEFPWKTLSDLKPYRIGTTLGNFYSDEFAQLQASGQLQVNEAASDLINLKKLVLGRIDLFTMEEESAHFTVDNYLTPAERARVAFDETAYWTAPVYLVIRRDLPHAQELMARFDRGFRQLTESGQLARLIEETRRSINKR